MSLTSRLLTIRSAKKLAAASLLGVSMATLALTSASAQDRAIAFEDIFANPGDKELNIAYAKQEAKAGNLLASAATLERLLLDDPNMDDARLFYAAVLYRLGDYQGAEREVRILEARPLNDTLRADLENFKAKISNKQKQSSLTGSLSLGYTYDDNVAVNQAENNIPIGENAPDNAFTARFRAKYSYDYNNAQDLKFIAVLSTFSKMYDDFEQVDFNFLSGRVGFEGARGAYDWRVTLDAKNLDVAGDQYLKDIGVTGRLRRELTPKTSIQGQVSYSDQEYDNIIIGERPTLFENLRSGDKYTGSVTLLHKFSGSVRGSLGVGLQKKEAEYDPYANDTLFTSATLSKNFANKSYIIANYFYRDVEFDEVDLLVIPGGGETRKEDRHYFRAAVGTPLSNIIKTERTGLKKALDSVNVELSAFRDDRQANYTEYDFDNTGAELKFTWRFNQ